jgi:uncharacterized protein (DUF58 family)
MIRTSMSGLTTRGRCLLAAGVAAALCSAVLNERDLLRVAAFVVALPLLSALLATTARLGLTARRHLRPARVPAGEDAEVVVEVQATGRVPSGGLLLEDTVPHTLGGHPRFVVERLPWTRPVRLGYRVHSTMRGVYRLGPLRGRVTDPFGLAEFDRELAGQTRIIVVPRIFPLSGLPGGSGTGGGEDGSVRLRSGQGEDDAVVRQYRQGDDLRRVHWRTTARRDELMVRVEERPWHGGTTVLLDRRAPAHRGHGAASSLEWSVSFAASVCLHLTHCGHVVRLVTEDGQQLAGDGGEPELILDTLATLQSAHRRELSCAADPAGGQELIAVLGAVSPQAAAELARVRAGRSRSLAVLLDVSRWTESNAEVLADRPADPVGGARLLRVAGWQVVVADPATPAADVWTRLCQLGTATTRPTAGLR